MCAIKSDRLQKTLLRFDDKFTFYLCFGTICEPLYPLKGALQRTHSEQALDQYQSFLLLRKEYVFETIPNKYSSISDTNEENNLVL